MKLKSFEQFNCSLAQTLSVIGEHWTLLIIRDAFFGLTRFDQFHKSLGISRNVLTLRLKKLVEEGVLHKSEGPGHPEYRLSEKGLALQPILVAMTQWGEQHMPHPEGERIVFTDLQSGRRIRPVSICADDGRVLGPGDLRTQFGPGVWNGKSALRQPDTLAAVLSGVIGTDSDSDSSEH
ncbi:winged helix-turn-helix transcriptional regulator [Pseudomonas rhizosphaerae]|uniref:winged helix-turn-helix transcriptional regulator n=1 Tax=Pseudomonas rhizosphaerae TaxID=216142 RepID=UPI002B485AA1|nr:helix-turn-helix domain-containing protein [Pseudomonas rhizosphaerae]MEB2871303.1 helix-turn-helix domain-containing protein [Pseudomonas rhizosphaerae]